jgi:hypothetical protein
MSRGKWDPVLPKLRNLFSISAPSKPFCWVSDSWSSIIVVLCKDDSSEEEGCDEADASVYCERLSSMAIEYNFVLSSSLLFVVVRCCCSLLLIVARVSYE